VRKLFAHLFNLAIQDYWLGLCKVCRFVHRFNLAIQSYWLGLYKITAPPGSPYYWYATGWYSGSTSRYRAWARGYPRHKYDTCVLYTSDGWKDSACSTLCYFTCKKPAGTAVHGCSGGEREARRSDAPSNRPPVNTSEGLH